MYCKKCGSEVNTDDEKENGGHYNCERTFRYCNYCGKQETEDKTHYQNNKFVFCFPTNKTSKIVCMESFFNESKKSAFSKYDKIFPKFNEYLQGIFLSLINEDEDYGYGGDDINEEELIKDITTHDGYIVVYHDSDGRMWYKTVPNNLEILKYIVKSEHRVTLGMGCNQYVECVIFQGEQFEIEKG